MEYEKLIAERMRSIPSWTTFSEDPDLISLAGGLPDTSLLGAELHADLLTGVATANSALALQYGPTRGLATAKECVKTIMAAEKMPVDVDDVIITTGAQQAIDLLCRTFLNPGDVVICEAPTFPGALLPVLSHQASVVQVEMDDEGLRVDDLSTALEQVIASGRRPKFIYCVPTFQNPSGRTMSLSRRRRVLEIARIFDVPVVEDNPYGLLRYEGDSVPTMKSLDEDGRVLYIGTFSKILGPGLRVGWLVAPPEVLERVDLGKQSADLCPPTSSQLLIAQFFQRELWRGYVDTQVEVYRRRRDVMLWALAKYLPEETTWTVPQGGLFLWATLPAGMDSGRLLGLALAQSVMFVPGRSAYALPAAQHRELRLNFTAMSEERNVEGIRRLGLAIDEMSAGRLAAGSGYQAWEEKE